MGHKEQKDEFSPRPLETFTTRLRLPKDAVVGVIVVVMGDDDVDDDDGWVQ